VDWNRIEGSWKQFRGKAKSQWGALTDDELTRIAGKQDQLIGKLQERYGYSRDRARGEVERWANQLNGFGRPVPKENASELLQVVGNLNSALRKSLDERPRETLAVAAVVGFVLGALWRS
jgi:uncharacterized protein YjbJ (UPF0337 family)